MNDYFCQFETMDTFLYPLDYLGGISEKQIIETYRISPEDADLGLSKNIKKGERLKYKLSGDSLYAFGGFLKESWRANDILWGRLDGLNRIIEALISEDKIKNFPNFVQRQAAKEGISKEKYVDILLDEALYLSDAKFRVSTTRHFYLDRQVVGGEKITPHCPVELTGTFAQYRELDYEWIKLAV